MSRFRDEMKVIGPVARTIATLVIGIVPVAFILYSIYIAGRGHAGFHSVIPLVFGALACAVFACYILLLGYIAGDAKRRGMSPVLWVLLGIFIPNAIGIVLYFILRHPLQRTCSNCNASVDSHFAFCSSCGTSLAPACPSCKSAVEPAWSHCSRCGAKL